MTRLIEIPAQEACRARGRYLLWCRRCNHRQGWPHGQWAEISACASKQTFSAQAHWLPTTLSAPFS